MISASVRRRFASGAPRFASSSSSSTTEQATQKAQQAAQQAGAKAQQALAGAQKTVGNLLGCEYPLLRALAVEHRAALLPVTSERSPPSATAEAGVLHFGCSRSKGTVYTTS